MGQNSTDPAQSGVVSGRGSEDDAFSERDDGWVKVYLPAAHWAHVIGRSRQEGVSPPGIMRQLVYRDMRDSPA